jgi:hypothetical protein
VCRKPLFEPDEEEMLLAKADQEVADGLPGKTQSKLGATSRNLCRKLAEGEPDPKKRERLLAARCSKSFVKRLLANPVNVVAEQGTMKKQSFMSSARAQAKNPVFKDGFFAQIREVYADHFARGILLTPEPDNDQCYGGDEVGSNPAGGKHGKRVFCSMLRKQVVKITQGEGGKAAFWVTFFYWSRFDGQFVIPPCVVHEGADMSEFFALYLPSDWLLHAAPSGYMDREGWFKIACHFQRHCGPTRPLYLFFDGHDSHWDPDALQLWFNDQIFSFFGRAHGSDDDNVNDNGCNSKFHSIIEEISGDFSEAYPPVIRDNAAFYNLRIVPTWRRLKAEGGPVTVRAAAKCGLWPLNDQAENYTDGLDLLARKYTIAAPWRDGDFNPAWESCREGPKYSLLQARVKAPDRAILIRSKAAEFFEKSNIIPTQEITEMLQRHKNAKQNKVASAPDRMNPNTTYGLSVTQGVINQAAVVKQNKDTVAKLAARSKISAENKRVERRQLKSCTFESVLGAMSEKSLDWTKLAGRGGRFPAPELKLALEEWDGNNLWTKGKKAGQITIELERRFKIMRMAFIISMMLQDTSDGVFTTTCA